MHDMGHESRHWQGCKKGLAARSLFFARRYAQLDMTLDPEGTLYEHACAQPKLTRIPSQSCA